MYSRTLSDRTGALEPAYANLAERVRAAFRARPALSLTTWQTAEWLELDEALTCRVLEALAAEGLIERGDDDRYRLLLKH
jgi:DNA-binding IclR family transcriptional regulator